MRPVAPPTHQQRHLLIFILLTLTLVPSLTEAFRFTVWLGDKCTITGGGNGTGGGGSGSSGRAQVSDQEILIFPEEVDGDDLCKKYDLYDWGHDQSLLIRPEEQDDDDSYLTFYNSPDCSGSPLLIFPPALELRERPVAGCSNYAAAGITSMSFRKMQ